MNIGIVGHEAAKFTPKTEARAREIIEEILDAAELDGPATVVSGGCHLGGIDIWAEEIGRRRGPEPIIYPPKTLNWTGYSARNIQIAETSDVVHVLVVTDYPSWYNSMRFDFCYHCSTTRHIKSGGCWTAKQAMKLGKPGVWHEIPG